MSEDLSHDPHLRAALRHAPDHALAPPAGVSQTILNAARHVHKPARPAATPGPAVRVTVAPPRAIAWLRQWFASPRLAGGLATGLVAALGLGLWIDLGREPVLDRAPVQAANELRAGDAAPAAREPAPEPGAGASEKRDAPATATPAVEPSRAKRAQRAVEAKAEREPESARQAPAPPQRREAERARDAQDDLAKNTPRGAAPPAVAPAAQATAPAAGPAPTVAEATGTAQKAAQQATAEALVREQAERGDLRSSLAAARAAALAGARASAAEVAAADRVTMASPASALLSRARAESASGSARWTWMPPGKAAIVPMDADADAWLARVTQASRAHWTDATERAGSGDALEVRWWRDDWPQATLRIEADGLRWIEHNGRTRYAPLDPTTLQRLRNP